MPSRVENIITLLAAQQVGGIFPAEPLSRHCTWQIGGPADILVEPDSVASIQKILALARENHFPVVVIGQGSNLLFDDAGVRGLVMKIGHNISALTVQDSKITAEAGLWVPCFARQMFKAGIGGFEHIIGIPGTIGGLIIMNGGSQRQCIGDRVSGVKVIDEKGEIKFFSHDQCQFTYRSSFFQGSGCIVVEVEFAGHTREKREIHGEMLSILRQRSKKFPRKEPNCGSVFVSKPELYRRHGPPGRMIEEAGLKGRVIGGAEVSMMHANFIVNRGGATSADMLSLIDAIRRAVHKRAHVWLDCEVRYVASDGEVQPAHYVL